MAERARPHAAPNDPSRHKDTAHPPRAQVPYITQLCALALDTGLEIKKTAIAQGVSIEPDFILYRAKPDGSLGAVVRDDELITLKCGDEFVSTAPDDNS